MNKASLCILPILLLCASLSGQDFSWDFGNIKESGGTVFHTFNFVNTTSGTMKLGRISPSCDCVGAILTQESVGKGEMGEITVRFNPAGAAGRVSRYVDIYSFDGPLLFTFTVTADVTPRELSVSERFRYGITEGILANTDKLNFGYIPLGGYASRNISVINTTSRKVVLQAMPDDSSSLMTVNCPDSLAPGETGNIVVTISVPDSPDFYGNKKETAVISVDGAATTFVPTVSFICTDKFDDTASATPYLTATPSLVPLKRKIFSDSFQGESVICNKGKADLHIRAVETEPGVSVNLVKGEVLAPGAKKTVKASSQRDRFSIILITDDPIHPMKEIRFTYDSQRSRHCEGFSPKQSSEGTITLDCFTSFAMTKVDRYLKTKIHTNSPIR